MISVVAGTFNILHEGHKRLIRKAFDIGDEVIVGITTDEAALGSRIESIPLYIRKKELESFLTTMSKPWEIVEINDMYGPREKIDPAHILVVSEETAENGEKVNRERSSRGVRPLEIVAIPLLNAYNNDKISSTGIMKGEYSRSGNGDAIRVAVGSLNRVKVEAARTVMERIFGNVIIIPTDVKSGVSEQPKELETREGAINRAVSALGDNDMSIGIEAGVFSTDDGLYDFQYCAILDKSGNMTIGVGPGFRYPDDVAELVSKGMTVGDAIHRLYGDPDIGKKQGAVGLLSKGLLDRKTLTEQSITAAMIPRMMDL
ncbi:MAG: inosine/xanthosine triphosphatase [Candidatus Methanoplasma sp.]|jgi:inosine/xanthosine triphosphatase|nr:inosine/xanthosine triphosphatase [Candidatus Methanoplasma sp.]